MSYEQYRKYDPYLSYTAYSVSEASRDVAVPIYKGYVERICRFARDQASYKATTSKEYKASEAAWLANAAYQLFSDLEKEDRVTIQAVIEGITERIETEIPNSIRMDAGVYYGHLKEYVAFIEAMQTKKG